MLQIRFAEDIYCDYLHDCHQANKRLSPDDWMWYGRELHHIEIPNCDGGTLGPLNSQYLTTYQHWVAGVLQSEVVGQTCFAFVPRGVLPGWIEVLRKKWCASLSRKNVSIRGNNRVPPPGYQFAKDIPYNLRKPNPRSEKIIQSCGLRNLRSKKWHLQKFLIR